MNSDEQGYNGWTNYETWLVKLWIDNDQGSQEYWLVGAEQCESIGWLRDTLKDHYHEHMPATGYIDVYHDLLTAALSEVNWHEIAESLLEDVRDLRPQAV